MAKTKKKKAGKGLLLRIRNFLTNKTFHVVFGMLLVFFSILLLGAFISYFFSWSADQSDVYGGSLIDDAGRSVSNANGKIGARLGDRFIYRGVGISALLIPVIMFFAGLKITIQWSFMRIRKLIGFSLFVVLWLPVLLAFLLPSQFILAGSLGYFLEDWLSSLTGSLGTGLILFFSALLFAAVRFNWTPENIRAFFQRFSSSAQNEEDEPILAQDDEPVEEETPLEMELSDEAIPEQPIAVESPEPEKEEEVIMEPLIIDNTVKVEEEKQEAEVPEVESELEIEETAEEEELSNKELKDKQKEFGDYDPKLDLSRFKLPTIDLLKDFGQSNIKVNQEELEANKNRIVETLNNYNIEISKIKATIGPTVTLYEIVPAAGIRISRIKNLEDDIALSLSALGIRIIAPIPGRGTIGIEVPNNSAQVVSMRNLVAGEKFQKTDMELPVIMGKTISNESFMADLAKMPHLLMAGATGQGKSVGLNVILTSLLYKKHPSQVKFVLVDPKKVELTLFNKIERHYLAKLPDTEEAIITDTSKVITTLNSLCIEMDDRYELLKNAMCRNIKEYNAKFIKRKLNPEEGHRYLPYIVLVIDEFADLIMTAGKEVETPIARLAQLARAIGIHLIIATQRPSVNVITGIIKANFPARIAFRVTSKIDSRTILDAGGAEQLIGKGDMLYSSGQELIRIQCAFVDTPEVENITDYIGAQQAYPEAYKLPEYKGEDEGGGLDLDSISDRDALFEDAARVIVIHQQGSASLLQRKLKLGYNRAGRIIDQLEAAGIIGPFEGSKARQVLVPDEMALEQLLKNEESNL